MSVAVIDVHARKRVLKLESEQFKIKIVDILSVFQFRLPWGVRRRRRIDEEAEDGGRVLPE